MGGVAMFRWLRSMLFTSGGPFGTSFSRVRIEERELTAEEAAHIDAAFVEVGKAFEHADLAFNRVARAFDRVSRPRG